MLARLLCWLLGHVAPISVWSVPANVYRCGRCRRTVPMEGER